MFVKVGYLVSKYGYGVQIIRNVIDRSEFAKYRSGGMGGIFFDLNDKSEKLLLKFLATKKRRKNNDITSRESI